MRTALFEPATLGSIEMANRIVMAPMTRNRAGNDDVPTRLMAEYYTQRASAGLIIVEGTQPSPDGKGYCRTPGIFSDAQTDGWRRIVDRVRNNGGKMVMQLMHCGRIASHYNKDEGTETVAPSAIRASGRMFTDAQGLVDFDMPRTLETDEIASIVDDYRQATLNAVRAGFSGVELHCTSGYLPAQFLSTGTNRRDDRYGGSVENRIRFVVETLEAMTKSAGADRVGLRVCPGNPFNDLSDDDPVATFGALFDAVHDLGLAYLHVIRMPGTGIDNIEFARRHFDGALIVNDSYDFDEASNVIESGTADAVSFARFFVANPDLVERFRRGADLAGFDRKTLYTPGARGYTDYPRAEASDD